MTSENFNIFLENVHSINDVIRGRILIKIKMFKKTLINKIKVVKEIRSVVIIFLIKEKKAEHF